MNTTEQEILQATLRLFRERGIAHVSTRDVAQATGLSRSHLYYYFPTWAAFRVAVFEHAARTETAAARAALARRAPRPAVRLFLAQCLPARGDASLMLWLDAWREAVHDTLLASTLARALRDWEGVLADPIERGRAAGVFTCEDAARAARQTFALANGYAEVLLVEPSRSLRRRALHEVLEAAGRLLGAPL